MRQIGARDEAKLLGDVESCGQQCCCIRFLKALKPVNMRMAKMQKATLDPAKISGYCGRLKCCLRYEQEGYEAMAAKLPRIGERIRTSHGDGAVVNRQILTQLILLRTDDGRMVTVVVEDVTERNAKPPPELPVARAVHEHQALHALRVPQRHPHRHRSPHRVADDHCPFDA